MQAISANDTSRFATISLAGRPLRIHYHEAGHSSAGVPVVLMLHGSGPGTTAWGSFHQNVTSFVRAGYRTLMMDLPGWGQSDSIICTGSRPELNVRCVTGVLDTLNIRSRVHVVGSSMGAHSALALALEEPQRVDRLILIAGGTGGQRIGEGAERMLNFYRSPSPAKLRELLEITTADTRHLTKDFIRSRMQSIAARMEHLENFIASFQSHSQQYPDVTARLAQVRGPALLVWGREDRIIPLETGLHLLAGLRDARLHVFGSCGHVPHQEHPDAFNRLALDFLAA